MLQDETKSHNIDIFHPENAVDEEDSDLFDKHMAGIDLSEIEVLEDTNLTTPSDENIFQDQNLLERSFQQPMNMTGSEHWSSRNFVI